MSYARRTDVSSETYRNICHSLKASPRYKGFAILAGENLLDAVLRHELSFQEKAHGKTDWVKIVEKRFPADAWELKRKYPRWDYDRQKRAYAIISALNSRERIVYLTFEGERFPVSSMRLACDYVRAIIPREVWNYVPNKSSCEKQISASGKAVFTYGDNEVVMEWGGQGE